MSCSDAHPSNGLSMWFQTRICHQVLTGYRLQAMGNTTRSFGPRGRSLADRDHQFRLFQAEANPRGASAGHVATFGSRKLLGCLLGVPQAKVHQQVPQVLNRHTAGASRIGARTPNLPLQKQARALSSVISAMRFQEIRWSLSAGTSSAGPASIGQLKSKSVTASIETAL